MFAAMIYVNFFGASSSKTNGSNESKTNKCIDPWNLPRLHRAVYLKKLDKVKRLLLLREIDVNKVDRWGRTALHYGCLSGATETVEFLICSQNDIQIVADRKGQSPIYLAIKNGHIDIVKIFCSIHHDFNESDVHGATPLHYSISKGESAIAKFLITKVEINLDAQDEDASTPLHSAVHENQAQIVKLLAEAGAIIDKQDKFGRTPIILAVEECFEECVDILIEYGASLEIKDSRGYSAEALAELNENETLLKKLHAARFRNHSVSHSASLNVSYKLVDYSISDSECDESLEEVEVPTNISFFQAIDNTDSEGECQKIPQLLPIVHDRALAVGREPGDGTTVGEAQHMVTNDQVADAYKHQNEGSPTMVAAIDDNYLEGQLEQESFVGKILDCAQPTASCMDGEENMVYNGQDSSIDKSKDEGLLAKKQVVIEKYPGVPQEPIGYTAVACPEKVTSSVHDGKVGLISDQNIGSSETNETKLLTKELVQNQSEVTESGSLTSNFDQSQRQMTGKPSIDAKDRVQVTETNRDPQECSKDWKFQVLKDKTSSLNDRKQAEEADFVVKSGQHYKHEEHLGSAFQDKESPEPDLNKISTNLRYQIDKFSFISEQIQDEFNKLVKKNSTLSSGEPKSMGTFLSSITGKHLQTATFNELKDAQMHVDDLRINMALENYDLFKERVEQGADIKCQNQKARKMSLKDELREQFLSKHEKAQKESLLLRRSNEELQMENSKLIEEGLDQRRVLENHKNCEEKLASAELFAVELKEELEKSQSKLALRDEEIMKLKFTNELLQRFVLNNEKVQDEVVRLRQENENSLRETARYLKELEEKQELLKQYELKIAESGSFIKKMEEQVSEFEKTRDQLEALKADAKDNRAHCKQLTKSNAKLQKALRVATEEKEKLIAQNTMLREEEATKHLELQEMHEPICPESNSASRVSTGDSISITCYKTMEPENINVPTGKGAIPRSHINENRQRERGKEEQKPGMPLKKFERAASENQINNAQDKAQNLTNAKYLDRKEEDILLAKMFGIRRYSIEEYTTSPGTEVKERYDNVGQDQTGTLNGRENELRTRVLIHEARNISDVEEGKTSEEQIMRRNSPSGNDNENLCQQANNLSNEYRVLQTNISKLEKKSKSTNKKESKTLLRRARDKLENELAGVCEENKMLHTENEKLKSALVLKEEDSKSINRKLILLKDKLNEQSKGDHDLGLLLRSLAGHIDYSYRKTKVDGNNDTEEEMTQVKEESRLLEVGNAMLQKCTEDSASMKAENDELKTKSEAKVNESVNCSTNIDDEMIKMLTTKSEERDAFAKECSKLRQEIEDTKFEIDDLAENITGISMKEQNVTATINFIFTCWFEDRGHALSLEKELEAMRAERKKLEGSDSNEFIKGVKRNHCHLLETERFQKKMVSDLKAECTLLKQSITDLEMKNDDLYELNERLVGEKDELQQQNKSLQKDAELSKMVALDCAGNHEAVLELNEMKQLIKENCKIGQAEQNFSASDKGEMQKQLVRVFDEHRRLKRTEKLVKDQAIDNHIVRQRLAALTCKNNEMNSEMSKLALRERQFHEVKTKLSKACNSRNFLQRDVQILMKRVADCEKSYKHHKAIRKELDHIRLQYTKIYEEKSKLLKLIEKYRKVVQIFRSKSQVAHDKDEKLDEMVDREYLARIEESFREEAEETQCQEP